MIAEFHKLEAEGWPLTVAGDQNAAKRGWAAQAIAKATGMTPGEPDVRVYLSGGRLVLLELKRLKGRLSEAQQDRHSRLMELGFMVIVLRLSDEEEARATARFVAQSHCLPRTAQAA